MDKEKHNYSSGDILQIRLFDYLVKLTRFQVVLFDMVVGFKNTSTDNFIGKYICLFVT